MTHLALAFGLADSTDFSHSLTFKDLVNAKYSC